MSEKIGRLGFLGLAVESDPGTPEDSPSVFIPFTENSLRGHHEPIMDISTRTSRVKDFSSVSGKKWGEGSVQMYLDANNAGYLFKLALGQEARIEKNADPAIHDHLFTPTVSGNAAAAATLWDDKGVDTERYSYAAIDTLEINIDTEGLATITSGFMSKFPSTVTSPTLTTASGTLYTWKDMNVRFGTTVGGAQAASVTKITELTMSIANSLALNYKSGSQEPDTITYGPLEVTGTYTLFFENATERDKYYNLTKNSMVITLDGAGLGAGFAERVEIVCKKLIIEDVDMETGLEDYFAITANFRAEIDQDQAGYVESTFRNGKTSDY